MIFSAFFLKVSQKINKQHNKYSPLRGAQSKIRAATIIQNHQKYEFKGPPPVTIDGFTRKSNIAMGAYRCAACTPNGYNTHVGCFYGLSKLSQYFSVTPVCFFN